MGTEPGTERRGKLQFTLLPPALLWRFCGFFCLFFLRRNLSHYMEHETALRAALSKNGDIELRFQGGLSIPVHSLKLKLSSSVIKDVITAVLEDQIASAAAKRRKTAEGGSATGQDMPYVQVSLY